MSARDEAAGGVGRPSMTPEERDAFNAWWNSLSAKGDPLRRPWLVNEAFHAAWNRRSPSPRDQASSAMLGALIAAARHTQGELCDRMVRAAIELARSAGIETEEI